MFIDILPRVARPTAGFYTRANLIGGGEKAVCICQVLHKFTASQPVSQPASAHVQGFHPELLMDDGNWLSVSILLDCVLCNLSSCFVKLFKGCLGGQDKRRFGPGRATASPP